MKKIVVSLLLLSILVLPVTVGAIPSQPGEGSIGSLTEFYNTVGRVAWQAFAIIALIMFIIAGVLFLTAGGDPEKVKTARNAFLWGVVGIIVAVVAFSIVTIISREL